MPIVCGLVLHCLGLQTCVSVHVTNRSSGSMPPRQKREDQEHQLVGNRHQHCRWLMVWCQSNGHHGCHCSLDVLWRLVVVVDLPSALYLFDCMLQCEHATMPIPITQPKSVNMWLALLMLLLQLPQLRSMHHRDRQAVRDLHMQHTSSRDCLCKFW
jgi:hypothetical protein